MLAVGLFAFAWKKKEHYLGIEYTTDAGLESAAVFHAAHGDLEEIRQTMLQQIAVLPAGERATATAKVTGVGDPVELLEKLSALRDQGILTEEEFDAKKAEVLARL